jgi:hypothetical protein
VRLYHYLEIKWALDDSRRRRLKVSKIDDTNDPYEFRCVRSNDRHSQLALEETERQILETYGVLCFSRSWDNLLMWSHYGERHKGMCLGFEVPDELTRPVEYVPEVQIVGNLIVEKRADFSVEQGTKIVERLLGVKYKGWCYEQEVRVNPQRQEKDEETGQYFVNFSEQLILREVIAGARFPFSRKVIEDALAGYSGGDGVQIVKVRPSPNAFEIVVDENGFSLR